MLYFLPLCFLNSGSSGVTGWGRGQSAPHETSDSAYREKSGKEKKGERGENWEEKKENSSFVSHSSTSVGLFGMSDKYTFLKQVTNYMCVASYGARIDFITWIRG